MQIALEMYNPILDRLPEDYQGWLIRTDYRIGIQIQLCISDPELSEQERILTALNLLYGNGVPDFETAVNGLNWFISCGNPEPVSSSDNEEPVYSFEYDAGRIISGFKKVFHIDISREKMHWFEFVPMLADLRDTAFSNVMEIRETDPNDIEKKRRAEFIRMKKRFELPNQNYYSPEEEAAAEQFMKQIKGEE